MRAARATAAGIVLALGGLVWACGERAGPVEPPPFAPSLEGPAFVHVSGEALKVLKRKVPLAETVEETQRIGADGGTIELAGAGIALTVPAGALKGADDGEVEVTVRAPAGSDVVFEFGPHGTVFRKPVKLEIDLSDTEAAGNRSALARLIAVYYEAVAAAGYRGSETVRVEVSGHRLKVYLKHFSGYLIAMG
ncbi:MAG: hypothetical protein HY704_07060 [Gemmatimonadetes bacterium]|nr:hypothetical protein [Gemmatimonadota bacterium]